jgi:hypothetical protein
MPQRIACAHLEPGWVVVFPVQEILFHEGVPSVVLYDGGSEPLVLKQV